ncbi:hypothetical protein, partial [Nitrosomonas sp.]|uniref:hypothetical protein n=1 Tax=Nitrosomonas sp. TaxID=42353 RepID=UPI00374D7369
QGYTQVIRQRQAGNQRMPSVKNIGKPCAGKLHARFDEEGLVKLTMEWLLRHRQTKGAETDKQLLMAIESQSFTLPNFRFRYTQEQYDVILM